MNRYYLVNVGTSPNRVQNVLTRLAPNGSSRVQPHQVGHVRLSVDGATAIVQGEVSEAEHTAILGLRQQGQAYVAYLGAYDPATQRADAAVYAEITANPARWERPATPAG